MMGIKEDMEKMLTEIEETLQEWGKHFKKVISGGEA